jgi:hypothetical protein
MRGIVKWRVTEPCGRPPVHDEADLQDHEKHGIHSQRISFMVDTPRYFVFRPERGDFGPTYGTLEI